MLSRLALILGLSFADVTAGTIVIRNVTLIDGTGAAAMPHTTLIIRGERIVDLGPAPNLKVPKGAPIVEGRGRYVIPGLWDMHVHLWYRQNQLPVYVANGVTGLRDMGSDFVQTTAWRRDIESGKAIGPHVLTAGPPIAGRMSQDKKLPVMVAITGEDARRAFDKLDGMDVDLINILGDVPHEAYVALAERARKWRMAFAGHVPESVTVREAIDARQGSIEHLSGILVACSSEEANIRAGNTPVSDEVDTFHEDKARELFKRSALFETRQVPELTLSERMTHTDVERRVRDPRLRYVPAAIRTTWPKLGEELKHRATTSTENLDLDFRIVKMMRDSGVEIMAGTDTGDPYTIPGITLHRELELLVKAGLTPMQAIQSATVIPARHIGWDASVGTLKKGMVADFVMLDANPLADIRNVSRISGVSIRGRYLAKPELTAILGAVK